MNVTHRLLAAAACLLVLAVAAAASDIEVTAQVDRQRVAINEPVKLTLSITSVRQLVHVQAPQLDLRHFEVYGPSVSTRMEIVNRRTSFSRDLVYTLYPREQGKLTIGAASFEIEGKTFTTDPIVVEVGGPRRGSNSSGSSKKSKDNSDELTDNLFLRAVADRDTVYVNEQVTASFALCYRYNLRDVGFSQIPTFAGFWTEELFVAQRLDPEVEEIDHRQFNVAPLRRVALFPTRDGPHQIEAMVVTCAIPQRRQRRSAFDAFSLFDDPLFGRTQSVMVRSVPLQIVARPLPQAGRPDDFTGFVGQVYVEAAAEPRQVTVGDPVTLRIGIRGTGNMQLLTSPALDVDGLKIYEPKGDVQQTRTPEGRLGGEVTYEYIVIPERAGVFDIPSIPVNFFDPETHHYRTASTRAIRLDVSGSGLAEETAPQHDMTRSEIEQLGSDVRYIKPDLTELRTPTVLYEQVWFWVLQMLLPVAYAALVMVRRHQERLLGDVAYARRRGADSAARERLQEASRLLDAPEAQFFQGLHNALIGFIADHANEPAPGLDRDRCRAVLTSQQVPTDIIERVDALLGTCEEGRFAPGKTPTAGRRSVLQESETLLEELGEALK